MVPGLRQELVLNDPSMFRKQKVWLPNWQFFAFCSTTTTLTVKEYYWCAIEALQFFFLLQSLTSNPHHDSYLCFIGRNLDLRTSMLGDQALQWKYHSRITTEFPQITLCLPVNSRITQNPFQKLIQWCQFKTARIPFATSFSMPFYISSYCSGFVTSAWCSWKVCAWANVTEYYLFDLRTLLNRPG